MIHRSITALALVACSFAPVASFAATSSSSSDNTPNITVTKRNMVHVTLKNRSNLTQNLLIEGRPVSLAANESYAVDVPAGTQIMGADNVVKMTIVKEYNGAVASFR